MTPIGFYDILNATTLESNKRLARKRSLRREIGAARYAGSTRRSHG